ncbi:hypothetical protein COO60DRAFT_1488165 [Scenedesmus sp. NREL 46B-D3]|nr:hypothetical protein COO60DRAFT_1488165 [Scenedesmus sp. NREL 46B-D3]
MACKCCWQLSLWRSITDLLAIVLMSTALTSLYCSVARLLQVRTCRLVLTAPLTSTTCLTCAPPAPRTASRAATAQGSAPGPRLPQQPLWRLSLAPRPLLSHPQRLHTRLTAAAQACSSTSACICWQACTSLQYKLVLSKEWQTSTHCTALCSNHTTPVCCCYLLKWLLQGNTCTTHVKPTSANRDHCNHYNITAASTTAQAIRHPCTAVGCCTDGHPHYVPPWRPLLLVLVLVLLLQRLQHVLPHHWH